MMQTEALRCWGHAGPSDPRTVTASEVRDRLLDYMAAQPQPNSGQRAEIVLESLGLTREYNGTWSFRFDMRVHEVSGSASGRRLFEGRYTPESGGIDVRERTHAAFSVRYYKDTT